VSREAALRAFAVLRSAVYATAFVLTWAWLAVVARRFDPSLPFAIPAWLGPVGLALAVVGAVVALTCIWVFSTRGRGTPAPFDAPRTFVASGPYRYVRNPMYIGAAAVIAGVGTYLRSPAVVLLAGGFLLFFHVFVIAYEEPVLRDRFGASYEEYIRTVRRWVPGPARPRAAGAAEGER
jgi:protein-S-isoprenylcysteine O-methyltransferase Ste14